jgi:two-component system, NarL family, nitrate/nitrite response regulator NarL
MRVLIVDDQQLFSDVVTAALQDHGVDVAAAPDGRTALDHLDDHLADVVLLDIGLPGQSGLEVGRAILERRPESRVIALTALHDASVADEALAVGFSGYLTKDTQLGTLMDAIRVVLDGEVVVPGHLVRSVQRPGPADDDVALLVSQLTGRELEVLELLAAGRPSDAIASSLHISRNTVRTHVQSIHAKLGVHSRLEAAAFASRHGLFENGHGAWRRPVSA